MQDKRVMHNRLLEITALAGEFPNSMLSRLYGQNYKEKKASDLRTKRLLKTYYRDGLRALRLTSRGRNYLLTTFPDRFQGSIVDSNILKPDIPHRLRSHMMSGTYVSMDNAGVRIYRDERPPLTDFLTGEPDDYPFPTFYDSREIKSSDSITSRFKGARYTGVLFTEHSVYICYNTGFAPLKWEPRAEMHTFAVVNALARELFPGRYGENTVRAIMFGDNMEIAFRLMTEPKRRVPGVFCLDGVFQHFHYVTADTDGDFLLEILYNEELYGRITSQLCRGFSEPDNEMAMINDGFDEDGNPVLFAFEFDMKRLLNFIEGVRAFSYEHATIICFDFQAETLLRICGESIGVQTISTEQTRRMFSQGGPV